MEILSRLLEISIYSVVLFLVVIAIKKVFMNKMSPTLHFVIWFLLIARLCVPVTIDSGLRLIVIPEPAPAEAAQTASFTGQDNPLSFSHETQDNANILNGPQTQQAAINNTTSQSSGSQSGGVPRQTGLMKWAGILIAVWILGILLSGIWMIYTVVKMNRVIFKLGTKPTPHVNELLTRCKEDLGIQKLIPVYFLTKISTPALTIGLKPKLVLPFHIAETLNEQQLEFAIKHELTHYIRKDNITCLLLRVLEAVYWFNPIVWLMSKYMIADMETACDSMVVRTLDKQAKKQYVLTLLDMFSNKKAPQFLLGMSLKNTEKIAEKRIRGVYMENKSKRNAKTVAVVLTVFLFFTCFTTACQPTPEKDVVVGKNNQNLDSIIRSTPAPTMNVQPTETWQEQLSGNNVTINIDAQIVFPQVAQLPVAEVKPISFTENDVWKAAKVFFKDNKVYEKPLFTKEVIEAQIITLKKLLSEIESGTMPDYETGDEERIKQELQYYTEMLQNAPSENDETQALTDLSFEEAAGGRDIIQVSANIGNNSYPATLMMWRNASNYNSGIYFSNRADDISTAPVTENNMEMTLDEAVSLAQRTMSELGIKDMILAESSIEGSTEEQGYVLKFIKSVNGTGISYYQTHMMTQAEGEASIVAPFLSPEQVTLYLNDSGILKFAQTNALEIGDVINENVNTLSIDEVKDIFRDQVFYNYYAPDDHPLTKNIHRIELGYFIQIVKDQPGVFRAIPVWDFLADEQAFEGDSYTYSVLTINAIDGSIIDRNKGY